MLTLEQAEYLVQARLDKIIDADPDDRCLILDEETIETAWGWVFFSQSRKYIESGDIDTMLAGNAPLIVNKNSGDLHMTGAAYDIQHYIDEYAQRLAKSSGRA